MDSKIKKPLFFDEALQYVSGDSSSSLGSAISWLRDAGQADQSEPSFSHLWNQGSGVKMLTFLFTPKSNMARFRLSPFRFISKYISGRSQPQNHWYVYTAQDGESPQRIPKLLVGEETRSSGELWAENFSEKASLTLKSEITLYPRGREQKTTSKTKKRTKWLTAFRCPGPSPDLQCLEPPHCCVTLKQQSSLRSQESLWSVPKQYEHINFNSGENAF